MNMWRGAGKQVGLSGVAETPQLPHRCWHPPSPLYILLTSPSVPVPWGLEALLTSVHSQTTTWGGVDIFSQGVTILFVVTGCYLFFKVGSLCLWQEHWESMKMEGCLYRSQDGWQVPFWVVG